MPCAWTEARRASAPLSPRQGVSGRAGRGETPVRRRDVAPDGADALTVRRSRCGVTGALPSATRPLGLHSLSGGGHANRDGSYDTLSRIWSV